MIKLTENLVVQTKTFSEVWYTGSFVDIQGNLIIAKTGFQSDGCTCAKDQPRNIVACVIHDALLSEKGVPLTRHQKDKVFYELLKEAKFRLFGWIPFSPEIYYTGVSLNTFRKIIFK